MKQNRLSLALVFIWALLPVLTPNSAAGGTKFSLAPADEPVGATITPSYFNFFFNWDNSNPELIITWNDATQVAGMSYKDDDGFWVALPPGLWEVVDNNGITATLIIHLDQVPVKNPQTKEGQYLFSVQEWRVDFDQGPPVMGNAYVHGKTFDVSFSVRDGNGNPVPTSSVMFWPYYGYGNPGTVINSVNYPTFEVLARRDYQYEVSAPGYTSANGLLINVEQDIVLETVINELGPTYQVSYGVEGGNGNMGAFVEGSYVWSGSMVEEGKDVVFYAYPYGGYTVNQ